MRVLTEDRSITEDRSENGGFCDEVVEVVVEVMVDPQGQIDHFRHLGDNFRAAAEPREKVTNVAVVLFDGKGQVFSGEELALGDETVIAFPVIGDEGLAFDADFVEEFLACGVITATKNPGNGSPSNRVISPPNPEFVSLFFTKCHISSSVTTTSSALSEGSGKFASFVPNPVQNCNIADAENACDGAEAHVAHGVEKQGQRLHRRRLATRRRHGEIAAARKAMIPLKAPHNSIFHVIRSAAALAANLAHHGGLLLRSPPRVCYRNG